MSEPFLAEIRMFGFNFAPRGWAMCNGQLLSISTNTALFSLLGTTYGGNGQVTFALPNLQGNVPIHAGNGPGLTPRVLGEIAGNSTVTVQSPEMPIHTHGLMATTANATVVTSTGNQLAKGFKGNIQAANQAKFYSTTAPNTQLSPDGNIGDGVKPAAQQSHVLSGRELLYRHGRHFSVAQLTHFNPSLLGITHHG